VRSQRFDSTLVSCNFHLFSIVDRIVHRDQNQNNACHKH
jgi:hypothetical protein